MISSIPNTVIQMIFCYFNSTFELIFTTIFKNGILYHKSSTSMDSIVLLVNIYLFQLIIRLDLFTYLFYKQSSSYHFV